MIVGGGVLFEEAFVRAFFVAEIFVRPAIDAYFFRDVFARELELLFFEFEVCFAGNELAEEHCENSALKIRFLGWRSDEDVLPLSGLLASVSEFVYAERYSGHKL